MEKDIVVRWNGVQEEMSLSRKEAQQETAIDPAEERNQEFKEREGEIQV